MFSSQFPWPLQDFSVTNFIFFAICGVVCVKLAHSSLYDWEDTFVIPLNIIIKLEVSTFPIVVIFFHDYVPEVVVPSYAIDFICIFWESWVLLPLLPFSLMICANYWVNYGPMVVFVCLHITLYIIIIMQMYLTVFNFSNACQVYFVKCVLKIKSILSWHKGMCGMSFYVGIWIIAMTFQPNTVFCCVLAITHFYIAATIFVGLPQGNSLVASLIIFLMWLWCLLGCL